MNYACINQWNRPSWSSFKEKVMNGNYEKVILFGQNEWAWFYQGPEFYELVDYCKEKNIHFEIVTGANEKNYPFQMDHVKINLWDTHWIGKTYQDLICNNKPTGLPLRVIDPYKDIQYDHHFISMNNRLHKHRCLFLDYMAKHDLMKYGAVSIHYGEHSVNYKWQYLDYKPMYLSDGVEFNQYKLPDQYFNSFAQLISESTNKALFLTEKTATPLIIGKPFLVASQMNFHKMLREMGFQLYDEIFDYEFDSEPAVNKRYDMIMQNFVRLCNIPLSELKYLQQQLAPKIMHNRNRAKEIAYDLNLYPKIVLEVIDHYKKTGINLDNNTVYFHLNLERHRDLKF
jgi:hypothetical protein